VCRSGGAVCPNGVYLPAGGDDETIDNNKQRMTNPAKILAINMARRSSLGPDLAILAPNFSSAQVCYVDEYALGSGLR